MGVLGSAFNPPHAGHLALAQAAIDGLGLDEVLLVPTGVAPHKRIEQDPGKDVRLEMARLAADSGSRLSVSEFETAREGTSYMFRTLELLQEERPDAEFVLLMGADAAAGLRSWREPQRIAELARIAVAERPGVSREDVRAGVGGELTFIEMPELDVSSSQIRELVAAGEPIGALVPAGVAELIAKRGIYGN